MTDELIEQVARDGWERIASTSPNPEYYDPWDDMADIHPAKIHHRGMATAAIAAARPALLAEGADRIEALTAENERLRKANGILEDGFQEVGDDYPGSSCQEWCQHQIKQARAALEGKADQ